MYTDTLFCEYSVSLLDKEMKAQMGEIICLELHNKLVAFIDDHLWFLYFQRHNVEIKLK